MFCCALLVGLLAAAVCAKEQPVTPLPGDCRSRQTEAEACASDGYANFLDYCATTRGTGESLHPLPYEDREFCQSSNVVRDYALATVSLENDYDRACSDLLRRLVCFWFFPYCIPTFGDNLLYVNPCYDDCVNLKAVCEPFIIQKDNRLTSWPEELHCPKLNYTDDPKENRNRLCVLGDVNLPLCTNRTTHPGYDKYYATCGVHRGADATVTLNPPPYNSSLTFTNALSVLDQYNSLDNDPLVAQCQCKVQHLLCLSLFPVCDIIDSAIRYSAPCYNTCLQLQHTCQDVVEWPESLRCSQFDYSDDHNACIDTLSIELACDVPNPTSSNGVSTITTTATTSSSLSSTSVVMATSTSTSVAMVTSTSTSIAMATSTSTSVAMVTSTSTSIAMATSTSTSVVMETPIPIPVCYHENTCAKVRDSVSRSVFKKGGFNFAINATILDKLCLYCATKQEYRLGFRVRIVQDYYLACTGTQFSAGDIVVIHTDHPCCIGCIDVIVGQSYLLMGTTESSCISSYSNGDNDVGWTLTAKHGTGGCVVSPWISKYNKICSTWVKSCSAREC